MELLNKRLKLKELVTYFPLIDEPPYGILPGTVTKLEIYCCDSSFILINIANSCPNLIDFSFESFVSFSLADLVLIIPRLTEYIFLF